MALSAGSCRASVLVVDDARDAADSTAEVLTLHGFRVRVARGGAEALLAVAADPPDVLLVELLLPQPDGCEVARRLRDGGRVPLLVALTVCGTEWDHRRAAEAGFDLLVAKPADPRALVALLARLVPD